MDETKRSIWKSPVLYSTIFAVFVCAISYYFISYKSIKANTTTKSDDSSVVIKTIKEADFDKDGLPDWREAVYGSDPSKKDTDGDGVEDGAEINIGHDPTKKGPDDILHNFSLGSSTSTPESDLEKTFVAEFMSKEIENIQTETVSKMTSAVDLTKVKPRYGLSNLNITSDNSEAVLRKYANSFGLIIKQYSEDDTESESSIMKRAIETKKDSDLQRIELPAIIYRNLAEDLRKLETPSSLAEYHLKIVSGYDVMSRSLFLAARLFANPIEGSTGWQSYLTQMVTVTKGYAGVINVLHDKHVRFSKEEPGYYFRWTGVEDVESIKSTTVGATNTTQVNK